MTPSCLDVNESMAGLAVVSKAKVLLMGGHHGDVGPPGSAVFRPLLVVASIGATWRDPTKLNSLSNTRVRVRNKFSEQYARARESGL